MSCWQYDKMCSFYVFYNGVDYCMHPKFNPTKSYGLKYSLDRDESEEPEQCKLCKELNLEDYK